VVLDGVQRLAATPLLAPERSRRATSASRGRPPWASTR
jgi:hypothetical protein